MGILIMGFTYFYIDNQSVLKNIYIPQSVMNHDSNIITYHFACKISAVGIINPGYVSIRLLTKPLATTSIVASGCLQ